MKPVVINKKFKIKANNFFLSYKYLLLYHLILLLISLVLAHDES